jgi:hypothetical protein
MSPLDFLALLLTLTLGAMIWQQLSVRKDRSALLELAREWGMHYSPGDRLNLAAGLAARLPVAGASNVRVSDLLYGLDEGYYRYVFRVDYTMGVVRSKHRYTSIAAYRDPRAAKASGAAPLKIAPGDLPIIEQYRFLKDVVIGAANATAAEPKPSGAPKPA